MPRLQPLHDIKLNDEQNELVKRISAGPRGRVDGPLAVWLRVPKLATKLEALGTYSRFESSLPNWVIELTILIVANFEESSFIWNHHVELATAAGISETTLNAIKRGQLPDSANRQTLAVFSLVASLLITKKVSDPIWEDAVAELSESTVIEMVSLAGYYRLVAMTLATFAPELS